MTGSLKVKVAVNGALMVPLAPDIATEGIVWSLSTIVIVRCCTPDSVPLLTVDISTIIVSLTSSIASSLMLSADVFVVFPVVIIRLLIWL